MGSLYLSFYNILFFTVFPIFGVILTGVVLRHFKIFDEKFSAALLGLVFYVSLPALMFVEMAKTPIQEILNWDMGRLLLAFAVSQLVVFAIALLAFKVYKRSSWVDSFIGALTGSVSNTALLGIPLLIGLFGASVIVPATITVAFVSIIFMPIVFLMIERLAGNSGTKQGLRRLLMNSFRNPLVFAPLLGFCFSLTQVQVPLIIRSYANYLQLATVPCALLAIGLTLTMENVRGSMGYSLWVSFLKLMLLPAIALGIVCSLDTPPLYAIVAVLVCSIPTAKMIMLLAIKYKADVERSAACLFMSHVLGFASMMFWIVILDAMYPAYFMYYANIDFT